MNNTQRFYYIYFCYIIRTSCFIYISLMLDFQYVIALSGTALLVYIQSCNSYSTSCADLQLFLRLMHLYTLQAF